MSFKTSRWRYLQAVSFWLLAPQRADAKRSSGHFESISKANFVTRTGKNSRGKGVGRHLKRAFGQARAGLAWPGQATTMPKKCAIQSWNLNNGNKNYEQEYFNVGRCHICIRKPLRVPHGPCPMAPAPCPIMPHAPCQMPSTQHWPQDEVDSPLRYLCWACAQLPYPTATPPIQLALTVYCCLAL